MTRICALLLMLTLVACEASDRAPVVATPPPATVEVFSDVAQKSGLRFGHETGATGQFYLPEIMGSGVALIDYDADGDLDAYLIQSARFPGAPPGPSNRLFRNELRPSGVLSFVDVTEEAGVGYSGYGMGAAVADVDNDGDQDLYVTNFGPNALFRNNGDGTFSNATSDAERAASDWSTSASFLDYDRDGDLDLYVASYVTFSLTNNVECFGHAGQRDYCDPKAYTPQQDRLWRNDGNARFVDVSAESGIKAGFGNGLGVTSADFNGDGWPDIYVANDQTANNLWVNQQDGTFTDEALISGCAYNASGAPEASMGVTAGDYDGDGDEDLFMTHLGSQTNTIYRNNGRGEFTDFTDQAGLSAPSVGFTGFGAAWFDVDNDGLLDLYSANGAVQIEPAQAVQEAYPYLQRNQLFRNNGAGGFVDVSAQSGEAMQLALVSRGAAFGDIDNDGDTDVLVTNNKGPAQLLLNERAANRWLQVRLAGAESNRDGAGARVAIVRNGEPLLWRRAHTDGSYLSASDGRVHFGLDGIEPVDAVRVDWPSGLSEAWEVDEMNLELTLREGSGRRLPRADRSQ
ncbi:MAG: CRTAC1 family protein [Gammaproteobacteria bacterium]|nr:CRTAC1 family protein [Gammaproteobacteria bacterium]